MSDGIETPASAGTLRHRLPLLGIAGALVLVRALAWWDPYNLAIFQQGVLSVAALSWLAAAALVSIELALSFRARLISIAMAAVGVLFFVVASLGLVVWVAFGRDATTDTDVQAVTPDGRVEAVQVDAHQTIDPKYDLALRTSSGLDRRMTVYFGCAEEHPPVNVRFVDNRTLEFTAPDDRVLRVRFDKNLNPDTVHRLC